MSIISVTERGKHFKVGEEHIILEWSSYKGRRANALASEAEEGRGKLRKAAGISKYEMIRRCPNGAIRRNKAPASYTESIGV